MLATWFVALVCLIPLFSFGVSAQDPDIAVAACVATIQPAEPYTPTINVLPDDQTPLQLAITYDAARCSEEAGVFIYLAALGDYNTTRIVNAARGVQFDPNGRMFFTAKNRPGAPHSPELPSGVLPTDHDFAWIVRVYASDYSVSATYTSPSFRIEHDSAEPPSPSGSFKKRVLDVVAQLSFYQKHCGPRLTACPASSEGEWSCIDTMSNLESCGGCPGSASAIDCSSVDNTVRIACISGECTILECADGHELDLAGRACLPM